MNPLEKFIWCNTIVAIIGTYLNAKQKRSGFIIWMITDFIFMIYNIIIKSYAQATLFFVYVALGIFGWLHWGKKKEAS